MSLRAITYRGVSTKVQAEDDKASLDAQLNQQLAFIEANGWRHVDDLVVPGHTRSYIDFYEMARDMAAADIPAFIELMAHWEARDFDVLLVRDGDRFAREQAPIALMVSRIIEMGARIYSFQDGWVDENNYRMVIAMWGYRAATEVDQMKVRLTSGKVKNISQGILASGPSPFSHMQVRDPSNGDIIATILDESKRAIIEDAARVYLGGGGVRTLERRLFEQHGHVDPRTGKPFSPYFFYHLFYNPWFWGNPARRFKGEGLPNRQRVGLWAIEPGHPIPEGTEIHYGKNVPYLKGELAEAVKAKLKRSKRLKGGARPDSAHRFTGLVLCGYCGFSMNFHRRSQQSPTYECASKYFARSRPGCTEPRRVQQSAVQAWLVDQLDYMAAHRLPDLLARAPEQQTTLDRTKRLASELADVEQEIRSLIQKQARADAGVADIYDQELAVRGVRRQSLQKALEEASRNAAQLDTSDSTAGFDEYLAHGPERFWQLPDPEINRILHRIMGSRMMVVLDGQVDHTGDAPIPPLYKAPRRKKRRIAAFQS